jgi:sugar lactone lactonase YvrE
MGALKKAVILATFAVLPLLSATQYTIYFTPTAGSPSPTGSFNYDPTIANSFSNFIVRWNGLDFDLTGGANTAGITDFGIAQTPPCLGQQLGAPVAFAMLSACAGTRWTVFSVTSIGPTFLQIGLPGPSGVLNPLGEMGPNFPWTVINGFSASGGLVGGSGAFGTLRLQPTPAEPLYISDSQNSRVRVVDKTSGSIGTVAGNGMPGFNGDGGPAIGAELHYPFGIALDQAGNLFVADTPNNRIRKVDTSGNITTVAGTGAAAYSGDGGPAVIAALNHPTGVAIDNRGNLYIADEYNNRIRVVSAGTITTYAGNGTVGNHGDGGPAIGAQLYYPTGVAFDPAFSNIYIADSDNQRIRKVDSSKTITTVAGNGNTGYNCNNGTATGVGLHTPYSVAVDGSGNLYIADYGNQCVRKVDTSGNITTVAGNGIASYSGDGGRATSAELNYPTGVAIDRGGNLFIADYGNNRVRQVDTSGIITTLAGNGEAGFSGDGGPAAGTKLYRPAGVVVVPAPIAAVD